MAEDEEKKKPKKEKSLKKMPYEFEGGTVKRLRPTCPRCGDGFFLAEHKDRFHCGHCGYTKWKT